MKALYALIGLLIIIAIAWFFLQGTAEAPATGEPQAMQQQENTQTNGVFSGSMQQLMARGGSWQCDVSVTNEGITTTGTTYAANGKMRADFVSNVPQAGTVESHMIMRDNTAYTWTSMMNRGFKFPIQGGEAQPEVSAEVAAQVNQNYDFNCTAWTTDESKFTLPSGVTF